MVAEEPNEKSKRLHRGTRSSLAFHSRTSVRRGKCSSSKHSESASNSSRSHSAPPLLLVRRRGTGRRRAGAVAYQSGLGSEVLKSKAYVFGRPEREIQQTR